MLFSDPNIVSFVISYDTKKQSIEAKFSKLFGQVSRDEEDAMEIVIKEYELQAPRFIGLLADRKLFNIVKHVCKNAIDLAYKQTGIRMHLDVTDLKC